MDRDRPGAALAARLVDPELWSTDPHPHLARMRREAPLAWNEDRGFWAVSRHADVMAVESDPGTFCAGRGILVDEIGVDYPSPPTMLHADPPVHTRYRRLVQPGFKPSVVRDLEPAVRARAEALVREIPAGRAVDILPALAVPFPVQVIGAMLGVPEDHWDRFFEWSEATIPGATDWPEEKRQRLSGEMVSYLLGLTKDRRHRPRHDVLTALAQAEIDGDQLTDDELAMFLVQLLVAGNETTRNMVAAGLVALAEGGDDWNRLRVDRSLVAGAVEEMLRWTTPVIAFMRTATADTVVAGQPVAAGEPLLLLFASANRDEAVFGPSAPTFDIERNPNPHVAFGFGNHFCLGAALARLEAAAVLEALLDRFAHLHPAGRLERSGSSVIAGVRHAPLRFDL
jgi:cytochrome P450